MYTDRQLRVLIGAGALALVSAVLTGLAWWNRPLPPDGEPILGSPQVVVFETDNCEWCETFRRKAARAYQEGQYAGQAPLRFMSVEDGPPPKRYRLENFSKTPMVVMFDQYGRELARIEQEPTTASLESLVRRGLKHVSHS